MGVFKYPEPDILGCSTLSELLAIKPRDYENYRLTHGPMSREEIEHIFRLCHGLWIHNGDSKSPHAELTSGKCSNGFVDTLRVLRHTNLNAMHALDMYLLLKDTWSVSPSWVIGSDHAAATFSYRVAEYFGATHDFPQKGDNGAQVWARFTDIEPKEIILQVEDLVTTFRTLEAVRNGVTIGTSYKAYFASVVATLVNRSASKDFHGSRVVSLLDVNFEEWDQQDCPLCAAGSKRIKPKQNWAELTASAE